jgi:acyl-CoA synthetase (AMP-forming)/AMP-acid ligase II
MTRTSSARDDVLLHDLLDAAAEAWPDRPAVSTTDATLSFSELAAASRRIAVRYGQAGVRPGDRVLLASRQGLLTAAALWGASRVGAVFVVAHEQVRGAAMQHLLDDSEPALLLTDDPQSAAAASAGGVRTLGSDELSAVASGERNLPVPAGDRDGAPHRSLTVDPACMIYTSGSTAAPKAVVSTHAAMVFAARAIQSQLRYQERDTVYCPLPLSFDYGLYQLFLGALSGAHVRLGRPAEVGPTLLRSLECSGATVLAGVPAVTEALARLLRRSPEARLSHLRLLTNTGAAMSPAVLTTLRARLPELKVQLMFGLTECKRATIMPPDGDLHRPHGCGRALPGTQLLILDDDGNPLAPGEIGQIVVRGPHVMSGYWRRPELTAQRFPRRHGLFPELHTGDYGWLDDQEYLYFAGRRDDIYKERGFRVSATEVEAAAMRVPQMESVAVLPPAADRPATMLAVTKLTVQQLTDAMREQLEEYKIPSRMEIVPSLPLSGNGKVDKKALTRVLQGSARA